jgi:hypothetical protein
MAAPFVLTSGTMAERAGFFCMSRPLNALLAVLGLCAMSVAGTAIAAGPGSAVEPPEQTTPQGEDPPGPDNGAPEAAPPSEHKGVIPPPDIGDEGIHTDVPNPDAGHEKEVIPPSEIPQQQEQDTQR